MRVVVFDGRGTECESHRPWRGESSTVPAVIVQEKLIVRDDIRDVLARWSNVTFAPIESESALSGAHQAKVSYNEVITPTYEAVCRVIPPDSPLRLLFVMQPPRHDEEVQTIPLTKEAVLAYPLFRFKAQWVAHSSLFDLIRPHVDWGSVRVLETHLTVKVRYAQTHWQSEGGDEGVRML